MLPSREEKMEFITDLLNSIKLDIGRKIATDAIPADWDGHELRRLLADKMLEASYIKMGRGRLLKYKNTVIINNL